MFVPLYPPLSYMLESRFNKSRREILFQLHWLSLIPKSCINQWQWHDYRVYHTAYESPPQNPVSMILACLSCIPQCLRITAPKSCINDTGRCILYTTLLTNHRPQNPVSMTQAYLYNFFFSKAWRSCISHCLRITAPKSCINDTGMFGDTGAGHELWHPHWVGFTGVWAA